MTPVQALAHVIAQSAAMHAELAAMQTENITRANNGYAQAFGEEHFRALIDEFGLSREAVTELFARSE